MNLLRCMAASTVVCAVALSVQPVRAQGAPGATYRPSAPTISSWMNLYQRNSGPLDNYHTFVRPERQLRDTLRQQSNSIQWQGEGIRGLTGQMNEFREGRSLAHPTGTGSVFMDYSHYYDQKAFAGSARPSSPRLPGRGSRGAF